MLRPTEDEVELYAFPILLRSIPSSAKKRLVLTSPLLGRILFRDAGGRCHTRSVRENR